MITLPSGSILVQKVSNNDFMDTKLESDLIPISVTGLPYILANISGANLQEVVDDIVSALNTKCDVILSGSVFNFTGTTTDSTEVILKSLTLSDGVAVKLHYDASAWNGTDNKFYWASLDCGVYRDGGNAVIIDGGSAGFEGGESYGYKADIKVSGNNILFTASGLSNESVFWRGKVSSVSEGLVEVENNAYSDNKLYTFPLLSTFTPSIGDAVRLTEDFKVTACSSDYDSRCIGILSSTITGVISGTTITDALDTEHFFNGNINDPRLCLVDFGKISKVLKVCNHNGNISAGDFLCSSSVSGHLMHQSLNVFRSFTIACALEGVVFSGGSTASGIRARVFN